MGTSLSKVEKRPKGEGKKKGEGSLRIADFNPKVLSAKELDELRIKAYSFVV